MKELSINSSGMTVEYLGKPQVTSREIITGDLSAKLLGGNPTEEPQILKHAINGYYIGTLLYDHLNDVWIPNFRYSDYSSYPILKCHLKKVIKELKLSRKQVIQSNSQVLHKERVDSAIESLTAALTIEGFTKVPAFIRELRKHINNSKTLKY